jgi:dinuclear metal center YbgI/SA1388 family protein
MAELFNLIERGNHWLKLDEIPDYPQALNGLQLENSGVIHRIVAAVDACLPVIRRAAEKKGSLLVVHHGLFWQGAQRIEGAVYEKLRIAMDNDLAIYSAHIPLDVHSSLGNNARLLAALELKGEFESFFPWKGIQLGMRALVNVEREDLVQRVERATGSSAHLCPGGPETIRNLGIITGGAGSEIAAIAECGVDTLITGEGPHWSYTAAEELGVNVIYGGHYATETFGVKALAERWSQKFNVPWEFIDHPTGL